MTKSNSFGTVIMGIMMILVFAASFMEASSQWTETWVKATHTKYHYLAK